MPDTGVLLLASLPKEHVVSGTILYASIVALLALLRHALMLELVLSRAMGAAILLVSVLPGVLLAIGLVYAAHAHPERAWNNVGVAAVVTSVWVGAARLPRLVRPDVDRDDDRWIALGALLAFPVGVLCALQAP